MAYPDVCLGRFSIAVLVCFISCFPLTADSYSLRLESGAREITVENGVTSSVDFYLDDYQSLDRSIRIIVQFKPSGRSEFDKKCQIEHSKNRCQVVLGPCLCVGPSSGAYQYRLSMNFTQQNAGQWMFNIVNHQSTSINIAVIERRTSLPTTKATTPAARRPETNRPPTMPPSTLTSTPAAPTIRAPADDTPAFPEDTQSVLNPNSHEMDNSNDGNSNDPAGVNPEDDGSELRDDGSAVPEDSGLAGSENDATSGSEVPITNIKTITFLVMASFWKLSLS